MNAYGFLEFNWQGEASRRRVEVIGLRYGISEWHKEPQWLLTGIDLDKELRREFAVKDITNIVELPENAPNNQKRWLTLGGFVIILILFCLFL